MAGAEWHRAVAYALVGADLPLGSQEALDAEALAESLAEVGWDAERVRDHARTVLALDAPWPHPIPDALRVGLGAAQLHAALRTARESLGVLILVEHGPSRRTALNADERRLVAEVPPHNVPR